MTELLWGIFAVAAAFFLGWKSREFLAMMYMRAVIDQMATQTQQPQQDPQDTRKRVGAKIEIINNVHYVYNLETDEFLAQGNTYTELQNNLLARYPDTIFMIAREHLIKVPGYENECV